MRYLLIVIMCLMCSCSKEYFIESEYDNVLMTNETTAIFDISDRVDDIMGYNDLYIHITNKTEKIISRVDIEFECLDCNLVPMKNIFGEKKINTSITGAIYGYTTDTKRLRVFYEKDIYKITVTNFKVYYLE